MAHTNYLILTHGNFSHLQRLIDALQEEDVSFFIHVDRKVREIPHLNGKRIFFCPQRFDIGWGNFYMIEATIALLQQAFAVVGQGRYCLLSGVDFPIKSNKVIQQVFSTRDEFINILKIPLTHKPLNRFDRFYFNIDRRSSTIKARICRRLEYILHERLRLRRKIPYDLYVGSQWFALTHDCVAFILNFLGANPKYKSFFRHSLIPDEAFFQTIVGNSPFKDKCKGNLTYTDWCDGPSPAMITESHVDLLERGDMIEGAYGAFVPYFARKFDDQSAQIVQRIEAGLRARK